MKHHALFFRKSGKISQNLSSGAVVMGALRVNNSTCRYRLLNAFANSLDLDQPKQSRGLIWIQTVLHSDIILKRIKKTH